MISGKNIVLKADDKIILDGVDFDVQAQHITFFLGRSGAGKTSLMRCVANLNPDYEGSLTFNGQEVKTFSAQQRARHIGFVAQSFNLFPHMTALENCSHPLQKVVGMDAKEADASAATTLERLHIVDLGASYPKKLSGGQQQRVAIARALCMKPEVLIMDEPTSALDPVSTQSLVGLIAELHEQGLTLCISSHDVPFVKSMLDRAYLLEAGKVVEVYDQQLEGAGAGEKIKEFLG